MGAVLERYGDAAYDHVGYAAQVLDDGSLTSTYSGDTVARMVGRLVAACVCGWTGSTRYPTAVGRCDEAAEDLALAEWERDHAVPTLEGVRAGMWDRLCVVVRRQRNDMVFGGLTGTQFVALSPADQRDVLDVTVAALNDALELAGKLRRSSACNG